jgi:D-alanyl-D-alanine carboxypeptidase/D-alanyl-D-alanine-endopeptidase (penicillin-binding protein 4)
MSKNSNEGYYFIKSLPLAGNSGTLNNFGKGTCLQNNLRAKTGSMKGVKAYCGYFNKREKLLAFTLIVNNYSCDNKKLTNFISDFLINYCN